jgi:hypothetical protein
VILPRLGVIRDEPVQGGAQPTLPEQPQLSRSVHVLPGPVMGMQSASLAQIGGGPFLGLQTYPDVHLQPPFESRMQRRHTFDEQRWFLASSQSNAEHGPKHCAVAAKAGVLRLLRIGTDQATAAPAPILLSIFLREIGSRGNSAMQPTLFRLD